MFVRFTKYGISFPEHVPNYNPEKNDILKVIQSTKQRLLNSSESWGGFANGILFVHIGKRGIELLVDYLNDMIVNGAVTIENIQEIQRMSRNAFVLYKLEADVTTQKDIDEIDAVNAEINHIKQYKAVIIENLTFEKTYEYLSDLIRIYDLNTEEIDNYISEFTYGSCEVYLNKKGIFKEKSVLDYIDETKLKSYKKYDISEHPEILEQGYLDKYDLNSLMGINWDLAIETPYIKSQGIPKSVLHSQYKTYPVLHGLTAFTDDPDDMYEQYGENINRLLE